MRILGNKRCHLVCFYVLSIASIWRKIFENKSWALFLNSILQLCRILNDLQTLELNPQEPRQNICKFNSQITFSFRWKCDRTIEAWFFFIFVNRFFYILLYTKNLKFYLDKIIIFVNSFCIFYFTKNLRNKIWFRYV